MAATVGVWEVEMDNGWNPYDGASNASLESFYASNPNCTCQLKVRTCTEPSRLLFLLFHTVPHVPPTLATTATLTPIPTHLPPPPTFLCHPPPPLRARPMGSPTPSTSRA